MNMNDLTVRLTMPAETQAALRQHEGAVAIADAYEVDNPERAIAANEELKRIKAAGRKLEELRKGFIAPAMQIVENARALFNPAIKALGEAENILKGKLLEFQREEQRRQDEARRLREEAERKARQEAEAKAAAERARAEEQAREARRKAQEADEARRKAEAEGNARAAAAAAAEAARQAEKAQSAIENGEIKAQAAIITADHIPPAPPAPSQTFLSGLSTRKNWQAKLADGVTEQQAIKLIAETMPARPELIALLALDMTAANKMAKALESAFNVPGLKAENNPQIASRK